MSDENITLVLEAERLIDGTGGPPVSPARLVIAGKKITYAGPVAGAPPCPACGRLVNLPGVTLLPGLIDAHVHPTYYWEEADAKPYTYEPEGSLVYSPVMIGMLAAGNLRQALQAGVTTARDMGGVDTVMFDVKRAIQKGLIPGPKMYLAGRLIVPSGGHVHYLPGLAHEVDGPYEFRRAVRQEIRAGADFIKLANNGADLTQEELNAAVDEAHRHNKKVACHTRNSPSQRMAIEAGVDTFEHGTPTAQELDRAVSKNIAWSPTLNISEEYAAWYDRQRKYGNAEEVARAEPEYADSMRYLERKRTSMVQALRAGVRLLAGTDSWMGSVRFDALADEIRWLTDYGCTPMQAIQAGTLWVAEAMGWSDLGALVPGNLADVLAVAGNPLADIRVLDQVRLVVREGEVVRDASEAEV